MLNFQFLLILTPTLDKEHQCLCVGKSQPAIHAFILEESVGETGGWITMMFLSDYKTLVMVVRRLCEQSDM